jgi:hypothetical protein
MDEMWAESQFHWGPSGATDPGGSEMNNINETQNIFCGHQFCVRVVPPEDGQAMPETCRDIEHQ